MIVIADPDRRQRARIASGLGSGVTLVEVDGPSDVEPMVASKRGEVELVVFGPRTDPAEAVRTAGRLQPEVASVLVTPEPTPEVLHEALRNGLRDVLKAPARSAELRDAVRRSLQASRSMRSGAPSGGPRKKGKVVSVFSLKGGSGRSVLTTNLGCLLASARARTALADLDLQSGDLAVMLSLTPARTICDLQDGLDECLIGHRSGLRLLAAPPDPASAESVSPDDVTAALGALRDRFAWTIAETPASFDEVALTTLDASDRVVVLFGFDVPGVRSAMVALQTLAGLGIDRNRLVVVCNRADPDVGLSMRDVQKALKTDIDVRIASSKSVTLSVNRGRPVAETQPQSPVATAIAKVVRRLGGPAPAPANPNRFRTLLARNDSSARRAREAPIKGVSR